MAALVLAVLKLKLCCCNFSFMCQMVVSNAWKFCLMAVNISVITREYYVDICTYSRSQWPRVLRRRSTAARLLRLWVRIPPGAWMSVVVSVVCCQVEVSATH